MAVDFNKVKAKLADLAHEGKEATLNFLDDFRRQTPYFKARVGVIAGFVFLVLMTLIIAPAPATPNPCDVRVVATDLSWKMVIEVSNESGSDFEALKVVVHGVQTTPDGSTKSGTWETEARRLGEDKKLLIEAKHLHSSTGERPHIDFKPRRVDVYCEDGVTRTEVVPRTLR